MTLPPQHYDVLAEIVGCVFVDTLEEEIEGVEGTMELREMHRLPSGDPTAHIGSGEIRTYISGL